MPARILEPTAAALVESARVLADDFEPEPEPEPHT